MSSDAPTTPSDKSTSSREETASPPNSSSESEVVQDAAHEAAPPAAEQPSEASSVDASEPETGSATTDSGADVPRPKIQVGSRRGDAGKAFHGSRPITATATEPPAVEATEAAKSLQETVELLPADEASPDEPGSGRPPRIETSIKPPSVRDPLPPDLEEELNAAMQDVSLDAIAEDTTVSSADQVLEPEARCDGTIVRIHDDNVFVALGGRNEGVVSLRSFREPPSVGDRMEVVIKSYNAEDGFYEVFVPGSSIEVTGWSDLSEGAVVEARITGANTGGLECMVSTIRGFIPASQIGLFRVEEFAEYIGQKLYCVATEVNRRRKNLVLSHRAVLEREKEEARKQLLEEIERGQTREGVIRSIQDFGAFVDLGGVDGLIHISQLSWERINHPSEIVQQGQKVQVKVEKINRQTGKIALSYRELQEHPWAKVEEQFPVGEMVKGSVTRVAKFGAFVKLAPGVEGLIHISELAHYRVRSVGDIVSDGQEVEVKVLSVDPESQRIALSIKAALPEPEPEQKPAEGSSKAESQRAAQAPKRKRPLKGGFDRPTGGEHFGLKW
ncbi:MAG: 30S ribosomal protein S1 [Pirellulaceae bacterium]